MADTLQSVFDLPDVSFTDNDTMDAMVTRMIKNYEARYEEVTGMPIVLYPSHPMRIMIYILAAELFQVEQYVERAGKQDLLKYSYGEFLDNLAANRGVTRKQASAATVTVRFTLSEPRAYAIGVPAGTRATNGNSVYFQTTEYAEIPAGASYADIEMQCTEVGVAGNEIAAGDIDILVDPIPYVSSIQSTVESSGGTETEDDESLAERVFLAPSSFSVAGSKDAYIYWAKIYNTGIGSVMVSSPEPCEVKIYVLMADGSIPSAGIVSGLEAFLSSDTIRPLTDQVEVLTPSTQSFDVSLTYYINRSDSSKAATIQDAVDAAVTDYILWQTTEIGRDINPSELIRRVMAAGAKRVVVSSPVFATVPAAKVAQLGTKTVTYGGLEDD